MLSVLGIFAVIASTGAYVEEYSKGALEEYEPLQEGEKERVKIINAVNGLYLIKSAIITGDTILYETNSISYKGLTKSHEGCSNFEGLYAYIPTPFCRMTHFGFRVTGTIPVAKKERSSGSKKYSGISTETSFGESDSVPLLAGLNSDDNAEKTYLEIVLVFKHKMSQGVPYGLVMLAPVFEIPAGLAAERQETLRDWAQKEASVGVSSPITPEQLLQLHNSKVVTISNLKWLQELLAYDTTRYYVNKQDIFTYAARPLVLSADIIEGIMKLARKFLKVNKTKNKTPTFSKSFVAEISRRVSAAGGLIP